MRPIYLIERAAYDDQNPQKMATAAKARGLEVVEVNYVPFGGGMRAVTPDARMRDIEAKMPAEDSCVFLYGSINAARYLARHRKWYPLAWADFDALRCQKYYTQLGPYLLQEEYAFMPLGEIYRRKEWVYKNFGVDGEVFIRPDDNAKSFAGEKVAEEHWDKWYRNALFYNDDPTILSIVSKPVKLTQEWRFIIANGKVITGSQYRMNGMVELERVTPAPVEKPLISFSEAAIRWAEETLAKTKYNPHPMFCFDVGATPNGLKVVEVGAVNTCGLYDCDIDAVVEAATPLAEAEWKSVME